MDSQDYQLVQHQQQHRGANRNSAEFLHSPRGRASEERLAPPAPHTRTGGVENSPGFSRGYYHGRGGGGDGDHRSSEYLLAPPRSSRGGSGVGGGRRSPLPGYHEQNTLPRGAGNRSRMMVHPGGGSTLPGRGRDYLEGGDEEEEDEDGEGIPLVEYHQPVSPSSNLRVPPMADSWRPNGGARPKQRYEVEEV